jgi:diguanylate cyclase (GGDEF)-like protein
MLILTIAVGVLLWAVSDQYQTGQLRSIFREKLEARFKNEAREHRIRFYRHINSYEPAVRTYANNIAAINYVASQRWRNNGGDRILLHEEVPDWLPKISIMRSYIWPRYAMLLDNNGKTKEIYHYRNPVPPEGLINITRHKIELSRGQSYITMFDGRPYVLSSEYIANNINGPSIVLASPIDEELLTRSLGGESDSSVVALLKDGESAIMVSSNHVLVPKNARLSDMEERYLLTGADHFDTGTSDLLLNFVSFISTDEVTQQTDAVINADRRVTAVTAFVFVAAFALVIFWITHRIQKLTHRVVKFSEDMEIAQPRLKKADQIEELENRFELLASAVLMETAALERQALRDTLTDLPNRKMFNDRLQQILHDNDDINYHFIILLIDLDRFKDINDTLGHHIGDVVLKIAAERLQNAHRNNDLVARLGGDEFGILLPDISTIRATMIVDKILDAFRKPFVVEGHNLEIGLSIGIAEFPTHGDDANILLQRADIAMYSAKQKRSGYSIYTSSEDKHTVNRLALMGELRQAMSNESLSVYYQPKVDLLTGEVCGAEALLRWEHEQRGFISPDEFIPLAEQTGLIQPLTCWVLEQSAKQCALWRKNGKKISVSVNVSVNCIHDILLPEKLYEIIKRYDLEPSQFIIELTENVFMKDPVNSKKVLNKIDQMGIEISIDDFGTGYSSLSYLKQLPVKEIKIDRSFVKDMLYDENDAVIVQTTTDLAHNLGMRVVAEGVENQEIAKRLKAMGCDAAQGYYYSRPVSAEDFQTLLSSTSRLRLRLAK